MSTFEQLCGFEPDTRDIAIDAAELRGEPTDLPTD